MRTRERDDRGRAVVVGHGEVANDRLRALILEVLQKGHTEASKSLTGRTHAWMGTSDITIEVAAKIMGEPLYSWPEDGDQLQRRITSHLGRCNQSGLASSRRLSYEPAYDLGGYPIREADTAKTVWATKEHADQTELARLRRIEREEARVELAGLVVAALHDLGCASAHPIPTGSRAERAKIVMEVEDAQRLLRRIEE